MRQEARRVDRGEGTHRPEVRARGERGYSFVEILVVMGIIAVLVSIGVGVYVMVIRKGPVFKTKAALGKFRASTEAWRQHFRAVPPSDLARIQVATGLPVKALGRLNDTNTGIESLYQCLHLAGFNATPEASDVEVANTDEEDKLEKPISKDGNPALFEYVDAWGNPYVYFASAEYEDADQKGRDVVQGEESGGETVEAKPWRTSAGGFAQPDTFQFYSMGPDGKPNTDDDLKCWEVD